MTGNNYGGVVLFSVVTDNLLQGVLSGGVEKVERLVENKKGRCGKHSGYVCELF